MYTSKLIAFALEQNIDHGGVNHVQVEHADNCSFLTGGQCVCNPDISLINDRFKQNRQQRRQAKRRR